MTGAQETLIRRLDMIAELGEDDRRALSALPFAIRRVPAGGAIVREGEFVSTSSVLIEGFTYRHRHTIEGKRQIIAFHPPGDMPDLLSLHMKQMDHGLSAKTEATIGAVNHDTLWALCRKRPDVAAALWRLTLIDGAIFRAWIVGLGRLSARERTARLLCELAMRLRAVSPQTRELYDLPLGQQDLADALGLTIVTVNQVLRGLREDGLVEKARASLRITDWQGLSTLGQFDGAYLGFRRPVPMLVEGAGA